MKNLYTTIGIACVMTIAASSSVFAQEGPQMNVEYEVSGLTFPAWDKEKIPASAFLQDASFAIVKVKKCKYTKFFVGEWGNDLLQEDAYTDIPTTKTYTIGSEYMAAALSGQFWVHTEGHSNNPDITVTVTNCDENYNPGTPGTPGGDETPGGNQGDPAPIYTQLTDLPTVYLNIYAPTDNDLTTGAYTTPIATVADLAANYSEASLNTIFGDKYDWYYQSEIVIVDESQDLQERDELVGVRGRGNSTWDIFDSQRKPLRLKFPSKTSLLGSNHAKAKSWTLLANHFDQSLVRNALTNEMGQYLGLPFCPAYQFVDLVVNGTYMGCYQISDHLGVGDKQIPGGSDTWWVEVHSGKRESFKDAPYFQTGSQYNMWVNIKNPEVPNDDINDPALSDLKTFCSNFASAVASFNLQYDNTSYRDYLDFKTAIDHFIGMDIAGNYDGVVANNYFYKEPEESRFKVGPLWDLDLAWGNYSDMSHKHFWEGETHAFGYAIQNIYSKDPYFVKKLVERWREVYDNGKLIDFLNDKVDSLARVVSQSATLTFKPKNQNGAGESLSSWVSTVSSLEEAYQRIKTFNTTHIAWLNEVYEQQYTALDCKNYVIPCEHAYDNEHFAAQPDGSYHRACIHCNEEEPNSETYFLFTVYPESATTTTLYAQNWQPSAEHPNAIAVVNADQALVEQISGYNIVCGRKNADGDQTCADFRLTDGHSFYSDKKFVATQATYSRNITNAWGTIVLPYKMQSAETEYANFYHLKSADAETLTFASIHPEVEGDASAYVPVVFKAKDGIQTLVVTGENITVKKSTTATMTKDAGNGWVLTGSMEALIYNDVTTEPTFAGKDIYAISKNQFWHATGKLTNNPFRAFYVVDNSISEKPASFQLLTEEESESGLDELTHGIEADVITLSSHYIGLPAGHYTIGGKQIIVK